MKQAWDLVLNWLSYRDRTEKETELWLKGKNFSEDEVEETLKELKKMSYIDDSRYARNYMNMAEVKGWGAVKLSQELTKKGIKKDILRDVAEEFKEGDSEFERALKAGRQVAKKDQGCWQRIWEYQSENLDAFSSKEEYFKERQRLKAKLGRNLCSKGFEFETVNKVIDEIINGVGIE